MLKGLERVAQLKQGDDMDNIIKSDGQFNEPYTQADVSFFNIKLQGEYYDGEKLPKGYDMDEREVDRRII